MMKIIASAVVGGLLLVFVAALLFTLPIMAGWNWGVLYAFPNANLGTLKFGDAFWFMVFVNVIVGAFKTNVDVKTTK